MANETITSGLAYPAKLYTNAISAAFVKKPVVLPQIYAVDWAQQKTAGGLGSNVVTLRKDGYLTSGGTVSEAASFSTYTQYQTSSVDITIIKEAVSSWLSVESIDVIGVNEQKIVDEQASAIARKIDTAILALASGFSNSVTASALLLVDDILDAVYQCTKNTEGVTTKTNAIISRKSANAIKKELKNSAASVYTLPVMLSLLGTPGSEVQSNGHIGSLPGCEVFSSSGFATGGGDDYQMVFDPAIALAGVFAPQVKTMIIPKGAGNPSFGYEINSYLHYGITEWNDSAGCFLKSDT